MKVIPFLTLLIASLISGAAWGQTRSQVYGNTLTKQTQTAFVQYDYGWQTYRSEAADSNATSNMQSITFGGYAGESRRLGVYFSSNSSNTSFDLNNSSVGTTWNMMALELRLGVFSPYVAAGQNEIKVKREEATTADVFGTNVGGGLKVAIPLTSSILVHADSRTLTEVTTHDKDARNAAGQGLLEAEVAATADIIEKYLDVIVGYKHRSYKFKVEDESFNEVQSAPFAGMRLGLYF